MSGDELVSVIIPTYNRAGTILKSVKSVLEQTYQNIEIIIVDDGSSDNTEDIINKLNSKKIRYVKHSKNMGAGAARNTGIKAARGKYISFQDSDDEWLPEKLEKQIEVIAGLPIEFGVVYCGILKIGCNKNIYMPSFKNITLMDGDIYQILLDEIMIGTVMILARRECFEAAGIFDETLKTLEDWELCLRIAGKYKFKFIKDVLVYSYHSSDGVGEFKDYESSERIYQMHKEAINKSKKAVYRFNYMLGCHLLAAGQMPEGRRKILNAMLNGKISIKAIVMLMISLLPYRFYIMVNNFIKRIVN